MQLHTLCGPGITIQYNMKTDEGWKRKTKSDVNAGRRKMKGRQKSDDFEDKENKIQNESRKTRRKESNPERNKVTQTKRI